MPKLLYSVADVIEATDLSRSTVYELLASGQIASIKVGARRLVPAVSLEDFVKSYTEPLAVAN